MAPGLLVIDMQKDLCFAPRRRGVVTPAVRQVVRAVDMFADVGLPVLYTQFVLRPDDPQFERFGDTYCLEGSAGAEIIDDLLPLRGEVIRKVKHSAFFDTNLHERLSSLGVEDLYLAGLQTQICIMTTAADASFRGYRPIVIEECVVSTRAAVKAQALAWIAKYVGEVQALEAVQRQVIGDANSFFAK